MVVASSSAPRDGKRGFRRTTTKREDSKGATQKEADEQTQPKLALRARFPTFRAVVSDGMCATSL